MSRHGGNLARWALLCALVWAVLAMHHVGSPSASPADGHATTSHAEHTPAPQPSGDAPAPTPAHDLLHLCMAIAAAVGIALTLRLLRRIGAWTPGVRPVTGYRAVRTPARPPPRWGRELLHSVGVLRV